MNQKIQQKTLKELRGHTKTQEKFAKELGVSTSLYVKYETGEREVSKNFIKKLKAAFPELDTNIFFNS